MANNTLDLDFEVPGYDKKPKGLTRRFSKKFNKIFLIASAGVLVVALAVAAVLLLIGGAPPAMRVLDFNTAISGVSVGGINISNMTRQQALEATAQLETNMLAVKVSLSVNNQVYEFEPSALSITTDYIDVINQAMDYGRIGTIEERAADAGAPKNFEIKYTVDDNALGTALANLKSVLDKDAQDASVIFTPWGHTANADGTFTPYKPDLATIIEMCKTYAKKNEFTRPELVRIPEDQMPIPARYQFWKKGTEYVKDYRPADANISRFIYNPDVTGLVADTAAVVDDIKAQVASGKFETIIVPVQVEEAALKLDDIKNDTQLIASWSSYWGGHDGKERNYNVSMISSLINDGGILQPGSGTVLMPGVEWSVNDNVGYRENSANIAKYGWKKAAGLENGGTSPQYGGGVCQLGSTTFNAAIRAGSSITVVKQMHHTIPSDYIPLGLDATLSSNTRLDLILRNDGTMPYYLVSYIDPKERNVTVEIYGPPVVDKDHPEWGNVIYNYTSDGKGRYGEPMSNTIYCNGVPATAPDGTVIDGVAYTEYQYAPNRQGTRVQTYKQIYDLNGNKLWEGEFQPMYSYPVINGTIYIWGYAPGMEPSPSPSPETSPETSPTEE